MHTIELCNVRTRHILRNVSVAFGPGLHGLVGLNGAGKSTLLNTIVGLVDYEGEILIGGTPRQEQDLDLIGASINGPAFYPQLDATANLLVHARMTGTDPARIPEILNLVGLGSSGTRARNFSTGMKVRLALAMALLTDPPILLLDEPQNGLDPQGIADLRRLLRQLAADKTILISSHQLGELEKMVERVCVLVEGRVAYDGPLDQLAADGETLEDAFFRTVGGAA